MLQYDFVTRFYGEMNAIKRKQIVTRTTTVYHRFTQVVAHKI